MLKDHEDAYGYEIFDFYNGEDVVEIVERSDGYFDSTGGPGIYFQSYEEWPDHTKAAMEIVQGRVLDVGCGAGRFSLHLQAKGHDVLGIDNSPKAIEVCTLRGLKNTKVLPASQISSSLGSFDTIIMMGNNFGLFANPVRTRWLLRRFYGITSKDGRIIAVSNDIYTTVDPLHLEYQEANRQRGRMAGQIRLRIRHKKRKTPWFDYLMVSKDEMLALLKGTGWNATKFLDSGGSNYIAVLEKNQD